MERRGFIHDMLDVKILILYVMDRVMYPVDAQKIYELCYQDDCLSYFDVVQAIPQMVASGHLPVSYTHLDVYKRQISRLFVGSSSMMISG